MEAGFLKTRTTGRNRRLKGKFATSADFEENIYYSSPYDNP
jgi:hypothetical protein